MRDDDLYLEDDPYLIECARWRAVLGDRPTTTARRPRGRDWASPALAIALGAILGVLLAFW